MIQEEPKEIPKTQRSLNIFKKKLKEISIESEEKKIKPNIKERKKKENQTLHSSKWDFQAAHMNLGFAEPSWRMQHVYLTTCTSVRDIRGYSGSISHSSWMPQGDHLPPHSLIMTREFTRTKNPEKVQEQTKETPRRDNRGEERKRT